MVVILAVVGTVWSMVVTLHGDNGPSSADFYLAGTQVVRLVLEAYSDKLRNYRACWFSDNQGLCCMEAGRRGGISHIFHLYKAWVRMGA